MAAEKVLGGAVIVLNHDLHDLKDCHDFIKVVSLLVMEYKDGHITSEIIAAAIEVHKTLGNGFPELIYQRALEVEFGNRKLTAIREFEMPLYYKGQIIGHRRVDFLFDNKICVELKAVATLIDVHLAQALNYLEALNLEIGLLLNFGSKSLEIKRLHNKKYSPLINFNANKPI